MAERTNAERNWQTARLEEQQGRRETGEPFRAEGQRYRESSYGGGYQPSSYEQPGARGGYAGGWPSIGASDYAEGGGYYGQGERGGYGRPPGFRYQGTGYGASAGYNAELEGGEWGGRPGSYGPRGRETGGQRGGAWGGQWRGGEGGGFGGERGVLGGTGWRSEGPWEQDRDFGEEGGWGGGAGFRGAYGGGFPGQARGSGAFPRWHGGESAWRGVGAPGYPGGSWGRGPEWGWQAGPQSGVYGETAWGGEQLRGYGQGVRPGWGGGQSEWEAGQWGGRGPREWGEPGRGIVASGAFGDPWTIPGPFTGRGPEGYQRSGDSIRDDVCERLTRHGQVDASRIRVRIDNNNEVVLEGSVPDRQTKRLAEDVAESVSGVRDVQNRLRVSERDEGRGTGGGLHVEERDGREHRESEPISGRGSADQSAATRTGRPERDAERQKATARAKS